MMPDPFAVIPLEELNRPGWRFRHHTMRVNPNGTHEYVGKRWGWPTRVTRSGAVYSYAPLNVAARWLGVIVQLLAR